MTEFWVSQGNKWCEFCKIWLQNNPSSIRNHELGTRHRDCVEKKLTDMREKSAAKEKELKKNEKLLQQIEAKATRSYQKDIETAREVAKANGAPDHDKADWTLDAASGYFYNRINGLHYDSKSGFYYSDSIGKWVTEEEAYASVKTPSSGTKVPLIKKATSLSSEAGTSTVIKPPGRVVTASLNPARRMKGAASSVEIGNNNKRKRQEDEKPKKVSAEERAALKAREAARKRVEQREKPLLGLYNRPF